MVAETVGIIFQHHDSVMFIGQGSNNFVTGFTQTTDQIKRFMNFSNLMFETIFQSSVFEITILYQTEYFTDGI